MFYKMLGQEMVFQLLNLECKEDFSLWDDTNKRYVRQLEGVANMNDIKFMKQDLFKQKYSSMRKSTQYVRDIVVYDSNTPTQYLFGFKKTANDDLNKAIANDLNLGGDPRTILFRLRKTGQGKATTYAIIGEQRIGLPQNVQLPSLQSPSQIQKPYTPPEQKPMIMPQSVQNPITPQKAPETAHIKPTGALQQEIVLNKAKEVIALSRSINFGIPNEQKVVVLQEGAEKEIYGASCNYPEKLTEEKYIELWNDCARKYFNTTFDMQRIKDIYRELYSKLQ